MLRLDESQAVLLRLVDGASESQEIIKQNFPIIRKSVRKLIRKFDVFSPSDVVRPLSFPGDSGELHFQLRLTQNSDLIFVSEDIVGKCPWTDIPFVTVFLERQDANAPKETPRDPTKLEHSDSVGKDASVMLADLSTRLERVENLLTSAILDRDSSANCSQDTLSKKNDSSPSSKKLVPSPTKSVKGNVTASANKVIQTPGSAFPASMSNFKSVASATNSAPVRPTVKTPLKPNPKTIQTVVKTSVGKNASNTFVSSTPLHTNHVSSTIPQKAKPPLQSSKTLTTPEIHRENGRVDAVPRSGLKRSIAAVNTVNMSPSLQPPKKAVAQDFTKDGRIFVWQTAPLYLARLDEVIETVVAGLDDQSDFTIEPPLTQTNSELASNNTTTEIDFEDFVQSLPMEEVVVKKNKKKNRLS